LNRRDAEGAETRERNGSYTEQTRRTQRPEGEWAYFQSSSSIQIVREQKKFATNLKYTHEVVMKKAAPRRCECTQLVILAHFFIILSF
jgi:hypothetical protein